MRGERESGAEVPDLVVYGDTCAGSFIEMLVVGAGGVDEGCVSCWCRIVPGKG